MAAVDVLVTGATGLIGTHVVHRLAALGKRLRVLVRESSDTTGIAAAQAEHVYADLGANGSLAEAVGGAAVVIHLAGHLHAASPFGGDEPDEDYRLNVESTHALLEASQAAGVERFVFASSVAVYSPEAVSPISEDGPTVPQSAYGRSKVSAEALVMDYHRAGLAGTVVRPSIVYGVADRHFLPTVRKLSELSVLPLLAGGRNLIDLVAADDVAAVTVAAAYAAGAPGNAYNAASGHPTSLREILTVMHEVERTRMPRVLPVSAPIMRLLAPFARSMLGSAVPGMEGMVGPLAVRYGVKDVFYDTSRARNDLGVEPQHDFRSGMRHGRESASASA
jgi:nucleoside-diphosphate-sugar epimerase